MGMDEKSWVWLKETKATRLFSLFVTEYAPLMNFHEVRPLETTCTRIGESPLASTWNTVEIWLICGGTRMLEWAGSPN